MKEKTIEQFIESHEELVKRAVDELDRRKKLQKPMSLNLITERINAINKFLSKYEWMDFIYKKMDQESIILYGCIDLTDISPKIEITFFYPQIISGPLYWTMDETKPFIKLSSINDLKRKVGLYTYNFLHVFELNDRDLNMSHGIYISATGIEYKIIEE